jgi:hypothetical protein
VAALKDIAVRDPEAVTRALSRVPRTARVDVSVLVATLRKEAQERAEATKETAWRYAITLMNQHQLAEMKRLLEAGAAPDEAASRAMEK